MWRDEIIPTRRKAREFILADATQLTAVDRPAFQAYEEYPRGKEAIIRLPLPYSKHRRVLQYEGDNKSLRSSELFASEIDEGDMRLVATPDAILGIHMLELKNVSLRGTSFDKSAPIYYYCIISVGDQRKMTRPCLSVVPFRVRIDSTLYFTIQVSNTRDNYRNIVKFEIWVFQHPELHIIIGSKSIHLYTLIQKVHAIDYVNVWEKGMHAATFAYEFVFAYGCFGYGQSNQLRNTKSNIHESIRKSLFPRIQLENTDLVDNYYNARVPRKVQLIGMSNVLLYAPDPDNKPKGPLELTMEPKFFRLHHVEFDRGMPIFAKVNVRIEQEEFEADFNEIYGEFICLSSRKERVEYLRDLVTGRLEDIQEIQAGALFEDLDEDVAENIIRSDDNAISLIYPKSLPCNIGLAAYVEPPDEPMYETIPTMSRSPGWLGRIFGYDPIQTDMHHGEGEYPYLYVRGYQKFRESGSQVCFHGLKYFLGRITGAIWALIKFAIPDLRTTSDLPEIAVTMPSAQGSTTDLYVSWVTENIGEQSLEYISSTKRNKDPIREAYDAVSRLLYQEYERDALEAKEVQGEEGNLPQIYVTTESDTALTAGDPNEATPASAMPLARKRSRKFTTRRK